MAIRASISQVRCFVVDRAFHGANVHVALMERLLRRVEIGPASEADKVVTQALPIHSLNMFDKLAIEWRTCQHSDVAHSFAIARPLVKLLTRQELLESLVLVDSGHLLLHFFIDFIGGISDTISFDSLKINQSSWHCLIEQQLWRYTRTLSQILDKMLILRLYFVLLI